MTAPIESILLAASYPDPQITTQIAEIGPDIVAEALLAETVCRARLLDGPADKLVIQCDLGFGTERLGYLLVLGGGGADIKKGWASEAPVTFRQDLVDLLRELFGPTGSYGVTRELFPQRKFYWTIAAGMRQLVGALSQRPKDLSDLAVRFVSDKWGAHWYTQHYQKYFEPYRELAVKVLEIGVGGYDVPHAGGESLRMWKHYFRRGMIYGLDIFEKTGIAESRLEVLRGDQGDERFLDSMAREFGPFDIVIDDGSHYVPHVITSFNSLFPHVRPGGIYVVEDLATSYWPRWGGDVDPSAQNTSMAMVKSLLDGLNYQEQLLNHQEQMPNGNPEPSMTELTVTGVHVHHSLAVIEKGLNTQEVAGTFGP